MFSSGVEHKIDTTDHIPIRIISYRLGPAWRDQLRTEISPLLQVGIIRL